MKNWDSRHYFKAFLIGFFWLAFICVMLPFYREILLAAVFALAMEPSLGRLLHRAPVRWRSAVALALAVMFLALAVPVTIVFYRMSLAVSEMSQQGLRSLPVYQKLLDLRDVLQVYSGDMLTRLGLQDRIDLAGLAEDGLLRAANWSLKFFTGFLSQIPQTMLSLFIFVVVLYFFLAEGSFLRQTLARQKILSDGEGKRLIAMLQECSYSTVVSSVLIALMQASIVGIGSALLGTGDFTMIWVITFFCSFVPMVGAGPVALSLGAYQLLMGSPGVALGLLIVAVVAGSMDNVLRPFLIAGHSQLHPIVGLLSIIGSLFVFGMPGLFLGPVIAQVAMQILPVLTADGMDLKKKET